MPRPKQTAWESQGVNTRNVPGDVKVQPVLSATDQILSYVYTFESLGEL